MKKISKSLILAVVTVLGSTVVSSVEAISSDEAVQNALARVQGATIANVTEFNRDYEHGRLKYEGEIHYNGYEYDFEIDADTGTFTKWEVEQEVYQQAYKIVLSNIYKFIRIYPLYCFDKYNKKRTAHQSCSFLCYQILEEEVVNFMNEMLSKEGDTTMHDDEDDEVFERAVHNNTCFNFMF